MNSFEQEVQARIKESGRTEGCQRDAHAPVVSTIAAQYSYNVSWLSRPIIQYPQDIVAMQELIWRIKPDLIIETGIAHGGSLVLSASMLAMLDYCEAVESRSEEHTSELQSLMRISYAVFCLKKKTKETNRHKSHHKL